MKKGSFIKFSPILLGVLAIGMVSSLLAFNHNTVKEAKAFDSTTGATLSLVRDINDISTEDQVILINEDGPSQNGVYNLDGNKLAFTNIKDKMYVNGDYAIVQSAQVEKFSVIKTCDEQDQKTYLTFIGTNNDDPLYHKYLAQDTTYNLGAYTMDNMAEEVYWSFEDATNGQFFIRNRRFGMRLGFTTSHDGMGPSLSEPLAFRIYKQEVMDSIEVVQPQTRQDYYSDESPDFSGLIVRLNTKYHGSFDMRYEDAPGQIYMYEHGEDYITIVVAYGQGSKFVDLPANFMDNPHHTFTKVTSDSELKDYRGSYLLVYEKGGGKGYVLDSSISNIDAANNFYEVDISNNKIDLNNYLKEQQALKMSRAIYDNQSNYYLQVPGHGYLAYSQEGHLGISNERTSNYLSLYKKGSNYDVRIYDSLSFKNIIFALDEGNERFAMSETLSVGAVSLYKLDMNDDIIASAAAYIEPFHNATANCDPTGETKGITDADWAIAKEAFFTLSEDVQYYYATLEYTGTEDGDTIEDVVHRYEIIVEKYGFEDFMKRYDINPNQNNLQPFNFFNDAGGIFFVVLVGVAVITATTVVLVVKNRKHN